MAQDMIEPMDAEGVERFHILSHDLGGPASVAPAYLAGDRAISHFVLRAFAFCQSVIGNANSLMRLSIIHLPPCPGGRDRLKAIDRGIGFHPSGEFSTSVRGLRRRPVFKSSSTRWTGINPHPRPARRNSCFEPRSATRQTFCENTPKDRPVDREVLSDIISWLC